MDGVFGTRFSFIIVLTRILNAHLLSSLSFTYFLISGFSKVGEGRSPLPRWPWPEAGGFPSLCSPVHIYICAAFAGAAGTVSE